MRREEENSELYLKTEPLPMHKRYELDVNNGL